MLNIYTGLLNDGRAHILFCHILILAKTKYYKLYTKEAIVEAEVAAT